MEDTTGSRVIPSMGRVPGFGSRRTMFVRGGGPFALVVTRQVTWFFRLAIRLSSGSRAHVLHRTTVTFAATFAVAVFTASVDVGFAVAALCTIGPAVHLGTRNRVPAHRDPAVGEVSVAIAPPDALDGC